MLVGRGSLVLQARRLLQEGTALVNATGVSAWDVFTNSDNRFYVGNQMLSNFSVDSAEECARSCMMTPPCWFWSWCPSDTKG